MCAQHTREGSLNSQQEQQYSKNYQHGTRTTKYKLRLSVWEKNSPTDGEKGMVNFGMTESEQTRK
jgi:hypothetical protein